MISLLDTRVYERYPLSVCISFPVFDLKRSQYGCDTSADSEAYLVVSCDFCRVLGSLIVCLSRPRLIIPLLA